MLPLILAVIFGLLLVICITCMALGADRFDLCFPGIMVSLMALFIVFMCWGIAYGKNEREIAAYTDVLQEMEDACPGISTEYEHFVLKTKLLETRNTVRDIRKSNNGVFEYSVPDEVDKLHILTDKEIEDCVKVKESKISAEGEFQCN